MGRSNAPRILLVGRPGVGKTTVVRRLARLLSSMRVSLAGFTTEEIRVAGRRVGFVVESLSGEHGVLAHVDLAGPPRVGKYGVDLAAFERIALPGLAAPADVVVIDELGRMELASAPFRDAVQALFDREIPVVATMHAHHDPFTDALKRRPHVELVHVTERKREELPARLAEGLGSP
jgi:nucleoside-triphosphatase